MDEFLPMNELLALYKIVENILNDMDREKLYDGDTLSIFKERFDREFKCFMGIHNNEFNKLKNHVEAFMNLNNKSMTIYNKVEKKEQNNG